MKKTFRIIFTLIIIYLTNQSFAFSQNEKIKIGLLAPLSGEYKELGQSIIKSTRMALSDIGTDNIEIYPMDTGIDPNQTLQSATKLKNEGIKIFIGPIFFRSLMYLDEIQDVIFLSLTNKTNDLPKNVISSGVNSLSQLNAIKNFLELSEVITLLRFSSKSEITTESKFTFPIVYRFSNFLICFSLSTKSEFSTLEISSARFCFLTS